MRTVLASLSLVLAAILATAAVTDGFRVVTSESARRLYVVEQQPRMPDAELSPAAAMAKTLHGDLAADGRVALVDFIYTRCETLCSALGSEFQQLQRRIVEQRLQARVRLVSISFDPAHDRPAVLAAHGQRLRADPAIWQLATVDDGEQLAQLLAAFGIVVVPDGRGGFVHNAAIHVLRADGRLLRIRDLGAVEAVLADAVAAAP